MGLNPGWSKGAFFRACLFSFLTNILKFFGKKLNLLGELLQKKIPNSRLVQTNFPVTQMWATIFENEKIVDCLKSNLPN